MSDEAQATETTTPAAETTTPATENGAADAENKIDETPAKSVAPEVSKPIEEIKQIAEETVEEAIVTAAKSVDEKINVNKPEVNDNDLQENAHASESLEQSSEKAIVDTNLNNADASVSLGDCTNNNNPNPPPLPDCKPPSQVSVFAETALAAEAAPIPNEPDTKIEITSSPIPSAEPELPSEPVSETPKSDEIAAATVDPVVEIHEPIVESAEISEKPELAATIESVPKPDEIAETIAMLDSVNESQIKTPDEPAPPQAIVESEPVAEPESLTVVVNESNKDDVSADISSPLQQNSIESLPSPQSLSPSEVEENTATELVNEDGSLLPPPPPHADEEQDSSVATDVPLEQGAGSVADEEASQSEQLPPPPPVDDQVEKLNGTANGNGEHKTNGDHIDEISDTLVANGCHLNGDSRVNDAQSAASLSEKVITPSYETDRLE